MSLTASSANVEPPPLLFGQRSPSPPSFSSPPQSPTHTLQTHTPMASPPPPQPIQDIDMTTSATLPPLPAQNHDRQNDAPMQDYQNPPGSNTATDSTTSNSNQSPPTDAVAVEVAAVDDDAMDTSPDNAQIMMMVENGATEPAVPPRGGDHPSADGQVESNRADADQSAPAPPSDIVQDGTAPTEPPPPNQEVSEPPPPPPPAQSDTESSDDDDSDWVPLPEDTTTPDEEELKEIEASSEHSALDHAYWEKRAYSSLDEPEFSPGASGRIEWSINYNGTKDKPNRDLVMKSEPVNVGGLDWQIKFYPKGNDSDYLSVYVECLSVKDKDAREDDSTISDTSSSGSDSPNPSEDSAANSKPSSGKEANVANEAAEPSEPVERQHAPLPPLNCEPPPKRRSVAAQVSVVLYNPDEPRVNYSRTCLHRFCTGSPDWGWTRFHGPYYDIPHRMRGQRQPLLRNDKLAFTGYIRIVEDETDCLWEHHSRENPWDSFAMTGLQGLTLNESSSSLGGGNIISAIAPWMLFKPFRRFLYDFRVPGPDREPFARPKPIIAALQKVLYLLRTQIRPGAGAVTLEDLLDGFEWYGIQDNLNKLDVMEVWEVLRLKVEEELSDTPYANLFDDLFGMKKDHTLATPSYRVPVVGVENMQEAVNRTPDLVSSSTALPQLLTFELARQEFDTASRSYVKLMNKVTLDDQINVRGTTYTLYGFVVHKQTLQSYVYNPVIRPEGPGSKWYTYTDGREENMVKCLTKAEAIGAHEGKAGSGKVIGNDPVAYIVMYVRDDVAKSTFEPKAENEQWQFPQWMRDEIEREQPVNRRPLTPPAIEETEQDVDKRDTPTEERKPELPKVHAFEVINSKRFLEHEGPGFFDAYDLSYRPAESTQSLSVQLLSSDTGKDVRTKLATVLDDIKDIRQIKFWFIDAHHGTFARPQLRGTKYVEFSSGINDNFATPSSNWKLEDSSFASSTHRIWVHVLDVADLPDLPPEPPRVTEVAPVEVAPVQPSEPNVEARDETLPTPPVQESTGEDTPMSEPDEDETITQNEEPPAGTQSAELPEDTNMAEGSTETVVEPPNPEAAQPATDAQDSTQPPADTEMGGTQDNVPPPPPPPPLELLASVVPPPQDPSVWSVPPPPPPPAPESIPDEIYFFLKFFDAKAQTLQSRGSYVRPAAARLDRTISTILNLPAEQSFEVYEEETLTTVHALKNRHTFFRNDVANTSVLIVTFPLDEKTREALAERAAFADLKSFLSFRARARNFPAKLNGHFIEDYFSSQYYKGEIRNGHHHGHGSRIYHSGATYEGKFRLSERHGHGLYTFQNGDTYDGDWVANQQHGTGTFVELSSGNTYVGGWKNDKKFGEGVTHWKNAQEEERLCRICWEESADAAFYDCGHVVACLACARRVENCPVCRKRVASAMKLYYVS